MTKNTSLDLEKNQLISVVGNRPQFIKMTPVNKVIKQRKLKHIILHTGQHYDYEMNGIFFKELGIENPDIQISLNSTLHGAMTAELLEKIEKIFLEIKPKAVLIYGDTNSTLATALAAVKLRIPIAHVESGPRLGDLETPEEVNRIVADHMSNLRFVCDKASMENLIREGITSGVINSGDVMYDLFLKISSESSPVLSKGVSRIYMTLHRPQNVDSEDSHREIIRFIQDCNSEVIFPMHTRTKMRIKDLGFEKDYDSLDNLKLSGPIGYKESIESIIHSDYVITDSGGLQKEAYFAKKLAMLMLPETPWPAIKQSGWQMLSGWADNGEMLSNFNQMKDGKLPSDAPNFFGNGNAAEIIVNALVENDFFGNSDG